MIAAAAALALASCSSIEKQFSPPPKPTVSAPKPPPRQPAPSVAKPATPAPVPPPPAVTVTPAPPPPRAPLSVIGLSEAEVEALLGPPEARATEGAGRTWRYGAGGCAATLFFFLDVSRNGFYVLDQKADGVDGAGACLRRVADAKPK